MRAAPLVIGLALAGAGCAPPEPGPLPRVVGAAPAGAGVAPELEEASISFSAPVSPEGLVEGGRLVLVTADAVRDAIAAVESEGGAGALGAAAPATVSLEEGGRRVVLRPGAPLHPHAGYALVLSSLVRAADGRPVLDADGRRRPTIAAFETGAAAGPPPRPVITEVRADAETPEAGGEYVELAELGDGLLDLAGWRLAKRTASGALSSCAIGAGPAIAPGGVALLVGGAYDQRYALPAGAAVLACGPSALLGGIANDRPPEILLLDPLDAVVSSLGAGGAAPICLGALLRIDPAGPDALGNLACGEGTPGEVP
jgi:hypothetical protein